MITIKRIVSNDKYTLGALSVDNDPICWTLEEPYKNNHPNISCIPVGTYKAVRNCSKKFGECFRVYDLAGREPANRIGILIHSGNTTEDTSGCILLGLELGMLSGNKAVLKSKEAMAAFLAKSRGIQECELVISGC